MGLFGQWRVEFTAFLLLLWSDFGRCLISTFGSPCGAGRRSRSQKPLATIPGGPDIFVASSTRVWSVLGRYNESECVI